MLFADVIALLAVAAAKEDATLRQVPGIAATKQRSGAATLAPAVSPDG